MKLVEKADVVVENYRADVKFRLGIDYESLKKVNPRIILGSISGFGQDGPYAERAGFDQIAQGMGGMMWVTGMPGRRPGARRHRRGRRGRGPALRHRHPDRAARARGLGAGPMGARRRCCRRMISMCDFQAARWTIAKDVPGQAGNNHPTSIPTGVFKTKDGYINIAASGGHIYKRFCESHQRAGADDRREVLDRQGARQEPRRAERRDRQARGDLRQRRAGREAEQGGRAGGAHLQDGRDVRRSAGQAPEDGASGRTRPSSARSS